MPQSRYIVFQCPTCHEHLIADTRNGSKKCTKCGVTTPLIQATVRGRANHHEDALELIQHLKTGGVEPNLEFKQYKVR